MNLVISDPKTGNAYTKKVESIGLFLNKVVGEEVDLTSVGLDGYKAKITGGSDNAGFPMNPSTPGSSRKKIFLAKGPGYKSVKHGVRKRINVRGNVISDAMNQINLKLTHYGKQPLNDILPKTEKQQKRETAKDKLVRESLENVGNVAMAEEAKNIKGKIRR